MTLIGCARGLPGHGLICVTSLRGSLPLCGKLLLLDAFNNKLAESRELIADLVRVFLRWAVVPRLGFIHILELDNDDAVGWRLARKPYGLVEAASDIFAAAVGDAFACQRQEFTCIVVFILDADFAELRVDGCFITIVDSAWYPAWIGTEQTNFFTLDGDTLSIISPLLQHPKFPNDRVRGVAIWRKE